MHAGTPCHQRRLADVLAKEGGRKGIRTEVPYHIMSNGFFMRTRQYYYQSRFLGRGCDEALFSEQKDVSVKRGEAIQ